MNEIAVSVVIPVYNVSCFLRECLDSLITQTLKNIEIICVDDNSTDGCREILKEYAKRDSRIINIFHEENLSTSQCRKDGVLASHGKYVMFVDGDDKLVDHTCETAYKAIKKYKVDMVHFGTKVINVARVPESRIAMNQKLLAPYCKKIKNDNLVLACMEEKRFGFSLWNKIYNGEICRKAFGKINDGSYPKAQDLYAFVLLAYYSRSYIGIEDELYNYNFGVGVTGGDYITLDKYDVLLTQKRIHTALMDFFTKENCFSVYEEMLGHLYQKFLFECINKWNTNLSAEYSSIGFEHLIEVFGYENVMYMLSEKFWYKRTEIAKKMLNVERFRYKKRPDKMIKTIGIYYRCINNGGAQRVTAMIANILAQMQDEGKKQRYHVILITDDKPDENDYPIVNEVERFYIPDFKMATGALYRERFDAWQEAISKYHIDIVVSGMWVSPCTLWDILSVKGHPLHPAFVLHSHTFFGVPFGSAGYTLATDTMYNYMLCDGAVTLSESDYRYASQFCGNAKWIHNPLAFVPDESQKSQYEPNTLLWVGRISYEKQPLDLIRMMKIVVEKIPDAKLIIVGDGNEDLHEKMEGLILLYDLQKHINMVGFQEHVEEYYKRASIVISTSKYEGHPLVFAEAMAHQVPIVSYDIPWLAFSRDGRGICPVEQTRFDLLAEKVIELLENPELIVKIGEEGYQQIEEVSRTDIGKEWKELFDKLDCSEMTVSGCEESMMNQIMFKYITLFQQEGKNLLHQKIKKLEKENRKKERELEKIKQSKTYLAGRVITFPFRIIKRMLCCLARNS